MLSYFIFLYGIFSLSLSLSAFCVCVCSIIYNQLLDEGGLNCYSPTNIPASFLLQEIVI